MVIALVPQHAEKIAPPRTLAVPFPLGRPFAAPNADDLQHRVLSAALALLTEVGPPLLVTFEEDAPESVKVEEAWVCPVTFAPSQADESMLGRVLGELALLKPWYAKSREPSTGLSGLALEDAVAFVAELVDDTERLAAVDRGVVAQLKHAVEDIKTFYNVAATNQPGAATIAQLEDWYWGDTQAGRMIRAAKQALKDHPDKLVRLTANMLLVPGSQSHLDVTA